VAVKIKIHFRDRHREWLSSLDQITGQLRELGYDVSREHERYDILFGQHDLLVEEKRMDTEDHPVIVYERSDSAVVQHAVSTRRLLQHPKVIAWAKDNSLRDPDRHNAAVPGEREHFEYLNIDPVKYPMTAPSIILGKEDLAKIKPAVPMFALKRLTPLHTQPFAQLKDRAVDVMFGGTMIYNEVITRHRYLCAETIVQMKRNTLLSCGYNLHANMFRDLMRLSKAVVSPYGWGAYSWKDYEIVLCGAILVKPRCDYMSHAIVDFYSDEFCTWCDPNFTDLEEVVDKVAKNAEAMEEVARERFRKLKEASAPEVLVEHFRTFFAEAIGA
jgi:hypothetical protein